LVEAAVERLHLDHLQGRRRSAMIDPNAKEFIDWTTVGPLRAYYDDESIRSSLVAAFRKAVANRGRHIVPGTGEFTGAELVEETGGKEVLTVWAPKISVAFHVYPSGDVTMLSAIRVDYP
jgi:hypothetical protein